MIERTLYIASLSKKLRNNPAVVIIGPRQVGKTTLSKNIKIEKNRAYFDLESPNTLRALKLDPEAFLFEKKDSLVILDEVQIYPEIFSALRSIIDQDRQNNSFILLGSANPALIHGVSESLAGRVSYLELSPLNLLEVGIENQNKHWFRGGFPQAFLSEDDDVFLEWVRDYVRAYVERDINLIFQTNLNALLMRRLWTMLGHLNGGLLNASDLGRSLGVTANTVNHYIDILEAAFLLKRLLPWHVNIGKRLVKSPKIYLNDTGLLHGLLNIKSYNELLLHPIIGSSWENYVIQQIRTQVKTGIDLYFYRTHNGSEVDLVLVEGIKPIASIEIKNSNNPTISKGFYLSIEDLQTDRNFVITKSESYFTTKGVTICALADFLTHELPILME